MFICHLQVPLTCHLQTVAIDRGKFKNGSEGKIEKHDISFVIVQLHHLNTFPSSPKFVVRLFATLLGNQF